MRIPEHHFQNSGGNATGSPFPANFNGFYFHHELWSQFSPAFIRIRIGQNPVPDNVCGFDQSQNHIATGKCGPFCETFTPGKKGFIIIANPKLAIKGILVDLIHIAKRTNQNVASGS